MRFTRIMIAGSLLALILTACSKPQVAEPPAADPPAYPAPSPAPVPQGSPVTWEVVHLASGQRTPGGPLHLAPPYRFELTFSGAVDRGSVEAALARNGAEGRITGIEWSDDRQVRLEVEPPAPDGLQMATVDPSGGKDEAGLVLRVAGTRFNFAAFSFWPAMATQVTAWDPRTGETAVLARHPQPMQTVSASPDGRRHLLRRLIMTPGQSVGITGSAYLLDVQAGLVVPLGVGGLFRHQWSADGGLLVWGGCAEGSSCAVLVPPGPVKPGASGRAGRLLYAPGQGEDLAGASLSPDGRQIAVFAGRWGERLSVHLLTGAGDPGRVISGAAGVTQGPSGLTSVPAAWSPDGSLLAYGDGGTRREEHSPMKVWLLDSAGGQPRLLAERASALGPWSPRGDRLFLQSVGVVETTGKVLVPLAEAAGGAAWSPDGRRLFLNGTMYDTATWKALWETPHRGPAYWAPDSRALVLTGWTSDPTVGDGGVYRADGAKITGRYLSLVPPVFSRTGLVYLPNPDRVVDLKLGRVDEVVIPGPEIAGLGRSRVLGFAEDGRLFLAPGQEWDQ